MNSCTPPKTFELFLEKRQLRLNRFNDNYNKLVDKIAAGNADSEVFNGEVISLLKTLNDDNVSAIPTIEYEKDTLEKYRASNKKKATLLRKKMREMKNNNSGSLVSKHSFESENEKKRELSIKYSFILVSILLLVFVSIGLILFEKK